MIGLLLCLPAALVLGVGFVWPVALLARISLNRTTDMGAMEEALSLETMAKLVEDDFTWELAWNTATLSATCGAIAVALALPVALLIRSAPPQWRGLLSLMAVAPLLVSSTARVVGWMAILGDRGMINAMLAFAGLTDDPVRLINNWTGVRIGLTESLMPYACLVLIAGLGRLDSRLEEAAATLGATRTRTFLRVTLPLAAPALAAAFLLVFVLGVSAFVTPRLMGGGRVFVVATEIFDLALETVDWPAAAAMAMLLLGSLALAMALRAVVARVPR
ncbi:ABC transporter permease [Falsiroseomonas stagni]|uniref:Putative spermidine/putrescine transport system permease protein n=1 Tax=Falsiroseomonas stagni DSM 19981 TaxID=1123062 RepID=A0A1I3Y6P0_9PROT|nr:ABC transporter permease subunit [Falsiroseomonas stagni]SFK27360.1 putative spermidine/putrescine transport system permease protein [Falsiroseomonas stagni DSM 19981]